MYFADKVSGGQRQGDQPFGDPGARGGLMGREKKNTKKNKEEKTLRSTPSDPSRLPPTHSGAPRPSLTRPPRPPGGDTDESKMEALTPLLSNRPRASRDSGLRLVADRDKTKPLTENGFRTFPYKSKPNNPTRNAHYNTQ